MSSCCPEYDHYAELLTTLLHASPLNVEAEKSLSYLRSALTDLRGAGCPESDRRALLAPAVLQLSMSDGVDGATKANLRAWLELELTPVTTGIIRRSTAARL